MNKKRVKPTKLPHGSGSIQRRGATLWIIYPDAKRRVIQENTRTLDWDEAFRLLLQRAARTLEERLTELRSIAANAAQANRRHGKTGTGKAGKCRQAGPRLAAAVETEEAGGHHYRAQSDDNRAERGTSRRSVPADSKVRAKRTGAKGGR